MLPFWTSLLLIGAIAYLITRKTPAFAYTSMVKLFCATGGYSNDWISRFVGLVRPPYPSLKEQGILFHQGDPEQQLALAALRDMGYYVFRNKLPDEVCDRLLNFALSQSGTLCPLDGQSGEPRAKAIYVRGNPKAVRYDFDPIDLLGNHDIQRLIADPSLARFAQDYLGSKPVMDVLTMWWVTDFSDQPDAQAAQFFHFDMDRPKWIKFFIYLTDVLPSTGPHTFIARSHRTGGIPRNLLQRGYARLSDNEVSTHYEATQAVEIVAPRGSILAEDTRGLHKGKHVLRGDRLLLQIQFSNCLFGGDYPRVSFDRGNAVVQLQDAISKFPRIYSAYFQRS